MSSTRWYLHAGFMRAIRSGWSEIRDDQDTWQRIPIDPGFTMYLRRTR
jgi:hypothetical protein